MTFLRHADVVISFPLVVMGAVLMLFGWRVWKACVALTFGLIGAGVGAALAEQSDSQPMVALLCGAALALVTYKPAKYAVIVLAGIIGAACTALLLDRLYITGTPQLLVASGAFVLASGFAIISRRMVAIVVTSMLGAVLVVSGVTALLMTSPPLYGTLSSLARENAPLVAFIVVVPAAVSCFYQVSEVHRIGAEL